MDIALIGGHGKVALLTEPLLTQAGHEVAAVIRNPDQATTVEATGARAVVADIESLDADGWDELLRGKDAVIWAAGAGGGNPRRTYAIDRDAAIASMEAAARVGVSRYVMVSYFGAGPDHGVDEDSDFYPYADAKSTADAHLEGTDLDWVILRPSALTEAAATGSIDARSDEGGEVSRENVAQVAAAVVEHPGAAGTVITFNDGPTPIPEAIDDLLD
ncbi:MAG: NAD(P)H-binding protein [Brachybacterium sp.]|nr:NAD(P)H-binding protein [Brachybacterium sp.]